MPGQVIKIYFCLYASSGRLHKYTASLKQLVIQIHLFENQTQNLYQVQIPVPCVEGICERFSSLSSSTKPEETSIYEGFSFTSCSDFICFISSSDLMMGHSKRSLKDIILVVVAAKALELQVLYALNVPPPALRDFVSIVEKANMGMLTTNADFLKTDEPPSCDVAPKVGTAY